MIYPLHKFWITLFEMPLKTSNIIYRFLVIITDVITDVSSHQVIKVQLYVKILIKEKIIFFGTLYHRKWYMDFNDKNKYIVKRYKIVILLFYKNILIINITYEWKKNEWKQHSSLWYSSKSFAKSHFQYF